MASIQDSLYKSFAEAETGGINDPWIRTYGVPGSSSTAYGPVQITKTLAEGYLKKHNSIFSDEEKDYLNRFVDQGNLFAKYGREPDREGYDPKFEYGGSGILTSAEDKAMYERVAKKMLLQHYKNNKGNLSDTIKEWRFGASSKKGANDDKRYWKEVEDTFVSQADEEVSPPEQEAPQYDPRGFMENLELWLKERNKAPSSASQTPSEADKEPEEETDPTPESDEEEVSSQDRAINSFRAAIESRKARGEKKLKRTSNEAKLEATSEGHNSASFVERLKSSPKAMEVLREKRYNRPINKPEPKEETVRREDASKDPTYGIF